ncbi:MAG: hypothetical protein ACR2OZ_18740 [Verrucomicrobiales bacterium]
MDVLSNVATATGIQTEPVEAGGEGSPALSDLPVLSAEELRSLEASAPFSAPSAAELLHAVGKLMQPRWRQFYRETARLAPANRYQGALALGALLTDIVLASQARDPQQVRNLLQDIEGLERMLGVGQQTRPRFSRLQLLAEAGEWETLRREADAAATELGGALSRLRDTDLTRIIPLGGWLRGLQLDADIRRQDVSKGGQPLGLESHFLEWIRSQLESLSEAARQERILILCSRTVEFLAGLQIQETGAKEQNNAVSEALGDLMNRLHAS